MEGLRKEDERRVRVSLGRVGLVVERSVVEFEIEAEVVKVWECGGFESWSLEEVVAAVEESAMVEIEERN